MEQREEITDIFSFVEIEKFDIVDPGCDQNVIEAQDSFFAAVEELTLSI